MARPKTIEDPELLSAARAVFVKAGAFGSTREIADSLVLSTETVRTHIKNILHKLDVHSRAEVVDLVQRLRAGDLTAWAAMSHPQGAPKMTVLLPPRD